MGARARVPELRLGLRARPLEAAHNGARRVELLPHLPGAAGSGSEPLDLHGWEMTGPSWDEARAAKVAEYFGE